MGSPFNGYEDFRSFVILFNTVYYSIKSYKIITVVL